MVFELMHPRDQIAHIMERIYGYGMTTTSGGNLSILDDNGCMWISPGGTDKGRLRAEDIVCVDPDGNKVEGHHRPSVEFPFHLALYRKRPDIRAVLHAHPPALVSFSIAKKIPDTRIIPKARDVCGEIGFAPYGIPGSADLGEKIARKIETGFNAVILESHGVVTVGPSLFEAFQRFETLDFCARLILKAGILGAPRPLAEEQCRMMNQTRNKLSEFIPDSHSSREKELRRKMCDIIHRAYDQMLITSTEGTFSCRVDDESFLITPCGMDRKYLDVQDLILIRNGMREAGKIPSRSVQQHMRMYAMHPHINAVIIAHPTNVMAFGCSGTHFDTRTIPESYIVLRDIPVIPYGPQFTNIDEFCARFTPQTPLLMVENDCLITTGKDLLEAYDRLEVAEFSAKAVVAAKAIGTVEPITDAQVADLCATFKLP